LRHRNAWAEEHRAPTHQQWEEEQKKEEVQAAQRREVRPTPERTVAMTTETAPIELSDQDIPLDILIVVSKLKKYIRARSGMNTSDSVMSVLSDMVREQCDNAIRRANQDGRKTVMDRDFE